MTEEMAIDRLFATYGQYGVTRELMERLFNDGRKQGFSILETYNLMRMSLGHEYGEREYFAPAELANMLDVSEDEIIEEVEKARTGNKILINEFRLYLPNGIK